MGVYKVFRLLINYNVYKIFKIKIKYLIFTKTILKWFT